jgi:hypothetical protein
MKHFQKIGYAILIVMAISGFISCGQSTYVRGTVQYNNPPWAPAYYPGVRYYYLPDIESYYDLQNNDFVYLDDGQWYFSASLPSMYEWYDLYNGFEIALNTTVYQPWLHHQYYISNYPRYYYRNKYRDNTTVYRGFNENLRQPIVRNAQGNSRPNPPQNSGQNQRPFVQRPQPTRPAQVPVYNGKKIGQPVKVHSNMREPAGGGNKSGTGSRPVKHEA